MQLPQQMPEALRQNAAVQLVVTVYTAWQRFSEQARDAVMKWIPNPENIDVQVRKAQSLHMSATSLLPSYMQRMLPLGCI